MKALLLALLLMPQVSVAAQKLLLQMSVDMSVPVPEPTSDAQLSYDADTAVVITFTAPAGKTLATNTLTCTAVTNDEFQSTVSEFPAGFFTDTTPPVTYTQAVSLLYQCSGFYDDGAPWSSEFPVDIFEIGASSSVPPPALVSQTTVEEGDDVDISFTAPAGLSFKANSLDCDIYDQEAEPRQRLGGTPDNLFTDSWSYVAGTPAVLWYECSGEYSDNSPWSLFFPLETVAASASAPPPLTPEQQQQQQQTEVATAALETAAAITEPFIRSMSDPAYMNYLTARVDEWTAISAFWCDTGDLPLQCNRVDQRRAGWFRTRQFFLEHLQNTSPLSKSDCAMTLMIADAEANLELEPFFYSFLADPQNSC